MTHKVSKQHGGFLPVPQSSGEWSIRHFMEYDEECTGLYRGQSDWMNDCRVAAQEHEEFASLAHGHVVLTGLGIGYLPSWLVKLGTCKTIRIVENSPDVIAMVWPHLQRLAPSVLKLVESDANEWTPDYCDFAWIDHEHNPLTPEQRELIRRNYHGKAANIHFWERM